MPHAFWGRKEHIVSLPYIKDFQESKIPTKARAAQMSIEQQEMCKKEILDLKAKNLIRESSSPWSCTAFYVNNAAEQERGVPRLVINFKPLNKVLQSIRFPIPNIQDILHRIYNARIFSKFDLKSGFCQIQIKEEDKYKTGFVVSSGHYEWNVMPFGLKNAPSEFQTIMTEIFNPYSQFMLVYIDDILIYSESITQHWKHLETFKKAVIKNGLVLSQRKMKLFQTEITFVGFKLKNNTVEPVNRVIEFGNKFPDEIKDVKQLQGFLGCLNYISKFYKNLADDRKILQQRLKKNPSAWNETHTKAVQRIKQKVKNLPCLNLANPEAFKIVQTDASEIGYGGILLQKEDNQEKIVRFISGTWNPTQANYSTIKKELLAIVLSIQKFQLDLLNKKFLLKIDCKSAKEILEKDVKNLTSKQIFARWQAILSVFDFDIEYINGINNSLADFLSREFLQKI